MAAVISLPWDHGQPNLLRLRLRRGRLSGIGPHVIWTRRILGATVSPRPPRGRPTAAVGALAAGARPSAARDLGALPGRRGWKAGTVRGPRRLWPQSLKVARRDLWIMRGDSSRVRFSRERGDRPPNRREGAALDEPCSSNLADACEVHEPKASTAPSRSFGTALLAHDGVVGRMAEHQVGPMPTGA